MKPLVIFHDHCTDGFGAAFAAWMKFGDDAEYRACSYGSDQYKTVDGFISYYGALAERTVYVLDFSFPREVTEWIITTAKSFVWLDHHKTAFEMWCDEETLKTGVPSYYDDGRIKDYYYSDSKSYIGLDNERSGALLAWHNFHPGIEVPMLINHIDDRDRWQFKIQGSKEFHAALASIKPWSFEQWKEIYDEDECASTNLRIEGSAILRAHEQNVKSVVAASRREVGIPFKRFYTNNGDGSFSDSPLTPPIEMFTEKEVVEFKEGDETILRAPGLSANCPPHLASDAGHELANQSGTFGLCWYMGRDGKAKVSLRSNGDYDVSAIAKSFGGGGHRNAAGFEIDMSTLIGWLK